MASPWEVTDTGRCNDLCDMNAYCAQLVPQLEYQCVCKAGYEGNGKSCGGNVYTRGGGGFVSRGDGFVSVTGAVRAMASLVEVMYTPETEVGL